MWPTPRSTLFPYTTLFRSKDEVVLADFPHFLGSHWPGLERLELGRLGRDVEAQDRKSTRLNSSHSQISYAVFCLKIKNRHGQVDAYSPGPCSFDLLARARA